MREGKTVLIQGSQFFDSDGSAACGMPRDFAPPPLSLSRPPPLIVPNMLLMWTTGWAIRHIITAFRIWVAICDVTCDM
jgi:hypothetical protein